MFTNLSNNSSVFFLISLRFFSRFFYHRYRLHSLQIVWFQPLLLISYLLYWETFNLSDPNYRHRQMVDFKLKFLFLLLLLFYNNKPHIIYSLPNIILYISIWYKMVHLILILVLSIYLYLSIFNGWNESLSFSLAHFILSILLFVSK